MKKRLIAVLMLTLAMLMLTAQAGGALTLDPKDTEISDLVLYPDNNSIKSLKAKFRYPYGLGKPREVYIVVLDENIGSGSDLFNEYETNGYTTLEQAINGVCANYNSTHANKVTCVASSESGFPASPGSITSDVFVMKKDAVPLSVNKVYYVYLFTKWAQDPGLPNAEVPVYPDDIIGVINVQNGGVSFKWNGSNQTDQLKPEETKPEEKPETKPEEKPDTKPEEKPDTKPEEKPTTEVKKAAESMPKTGDESLPLLYLALGLGCCAALVAMKRRKA